MDKSFDLIGVGSPVVDSLAHVSDSFVAEIGGAKGGMELVDSAKLAGIVGKIDGPLTEAPGGSAGNTAFAAARLGAKTTFLGKVGNDETASFFANRLEAIGADTSRLKRGQQPNARCVSLVTPDSQRTMRTDLGAAMTLAPDEVSVEDFANCRHAHIEGYLLFNRNLMMKVLDCARAAGCSISVDLASFEVVNAASDILEEVLRDYVDIIIANEDEASAWFKDGGNDFRQMALDFAKLCKIGIVKVGKEGSWIATSNQVSFIDPVSVPSERVIDTTGAGDFWAAGFLFGYLNGRDLKTAGGFGSRLGAEVVQRLGATLADETWGFLKNDLC